MKITVLAKPNARREEVEELKEGSFRVSVRESPHEGKANTATIRALAEYFSVPASCVQILSGHTSRQKLIEILGI